jgi:hypothetical protein
MGCGGSVEKDREASQAGNGPRRADGDATRSYPSQQQQGANGAAGAQSGPNPYRSGDPAGDGNETAMLGATDTEGVGGGQVTQAQLTELKNRNENRERQQGSTVGRWIESIVEPTDADSADVYDPLQRHELSMRSLAQRFSGGAPRE